MESNVKTRVARVVADLRKLAVGLTEAGNPTDAIRLQGCASAVQQLEAELFAAESRKVKLAG